MCVDKPYTIGELAGAAEVPTSTVRYYERVGILRPTGRMSGNYRYYDERALDRLRFIRAAQATGFQLDDVRMLLELADGETSRCREVQTLIEDRLADVSRRLKSLRHVENVLREAHRLCQEAEATGHCEVIDMLKVGKPVRGPRRRRKISSVERAKQ